MFSLDALVKRIKELRAKHGLTQQQLAVDTGLSVGGIQSIEIGRARPNIETLQKLADRFEVSADYLLGRDEMEIDHALPQSVIDHVIKEAEAKYGVSLRDDPQVHKAVIELIENIAKTKKTPSD